MSQHVEVDGIGRDATWTIEDDARIEIVVGSVRKQPAPSVDVVVIEKGGRSPKSKRIVLAEAVRILIDEMNRIGGAT